MAGRWIQSLYYTTSSDVYLTSNVFYTLFTEYHLASNCASFHTHDTLYHFIPISLLFVIKGWLHGIARGNREL